jgi:3-hydroxybutyryl-CoA dehydrogenase
MNNTMKIKNVTIAGAGVLGSQIAWQTAFHGFHVTVYDLFEKGLETCKKSHQQYAELFKNKRNATENEIQETFARLEYTTDLEEAVKDCDLISESVPETYEIKKSFYNKLAKLAPEKTIFTTNSSSMIPSQFVDETGRPDRFLALHFANGIWEANVGEVMGHPTTDKAIFNQVVEFARAIGMVPIIIKKEQPGYVLNSLLIPLLASAAELLAKGVSDIESIDKTWMITTGVKKGPFAMMDMIGLETVYHVIEGLSQQPEHEAMADLAVFLKTNYVDQGNLGVKSGKGFYSYPNPKYRDKDFLK